MSVNILFVEDNEHKRTRVTEFLRSLNVDIDVDDAKSYTAGCQALTQKKYALILLDVSLPTYDRSASNSGGRFRPFAGREIARKITRRKQQTKIMFITQYSSFSDRETSYSYSELQELVAIDCGERFAGMVFYDSSQSVWKEELARVIASVA